MFQAYSSRSQGTDGADGFVAGTFVHTGQPIPQFPVDEQSYLLDLERHLGRKHQGYTPFVSVSQNLLRVFHHALRCNRNAEKGESQNWNLAVIQLSGVPSLTRAVWDLDAGEHSSRAFGEWVGE